MMRVEWPQDKTNFLVNLCEILKLDFSIVVESVGSKAPAKAKGSLAKAAQAKAILPMAPYCKAVIDDDSIES